MSRSGSLSKPEVNMIVRQETDRMSLQMKNFYELKMKEVMDRLSALEES